MANKCLKIGQDIDTCPQRIEDGHCFCCPFYQDVSGFVEISEETKVKALEAFIEAANVVLNSVEDKSPYMVMGIERKENDNGKRDNI